MNLLQSLGMKYGTDKSLHSHNGITYLDIYNRHFEHSRFVVKNFVEIGILNGASLRMWKEYFPNATIHGIDIDPSKKVYEEDRIKVHIGSQADESFLKSLSSFFDKIDILVDDGSHITEHQIKTFNVLYPMITNNGYYAIEDLRNSYEEYLNHHDVRQIWPGMKYNDPNDSLKNYRADFNSWIQDKVKKLDFHDKSNNLIGIYHYPMIVIFENNNKN